MKTSSGERRREDAGRIAAALEGYGRVSLRVQGTSMLPWVRPGDTVIIRKIRPSEVQCGDIVLFQRGERLFVHRIVSLVSANETSFVAKGDANPQLDGALEPQEILGRVEGIFRRGRRIKFHSRQKRVLALLIAQISRHSRLWFALVRVHGIAVRPARRLLWALRPSRAAAR